MGRFSTVVRNSSSVPRRVSAHFPPAMPRILCWPPSMTNRIRRSTKAPRRRIVLGAALAILFVASGAGSPAAARELVVFEATSLKDVFAKLAQRFEQDSTGVKVVANAAGSQELRTQIEHGAAADV